MPAPGDAPCAAARTTAPTDDSTDTLHTAAEDEPDGMLKDTVAVSTTVVGGTDDTDGLSDGVTDGDTLEETEMLPVTDDEKDADSDIDGVSVSAELPLGVALTEADAATETLAEDDSVIEALSDDDAVIEALSDDDTATDALTDDDVDGDTDAAEDTLAVALGDTVELALTLADDEGETLLDTTADALRLPLDDTLTDAELE